MKMYLFIIFLLAGFTTFEDISGQINNIIPVKSPNNKTCCEFRVNNHGILQYRVSYNKKKAIVWSELGFVLNRKVIGENTVIKSKKFRVNNEKFAWSLGENDTIINNYNEMVISCESNLLQFNLIVRVFDGSAAFRYEVPFQNGLTECAVNKENTVFNFSGNSTIYQYNQESEFKPILIDSLSKTCDFPATLHGRSLYISISEAENDWFTKAELIKGMQSNSLAIVYNRDSAIRVNGPFQTPWRTISISNTAIGLLKYSDLNLRLTHTSLKEVPGWIKPGKLIRSQLNTQSALDCIDFAVKHNLQYIMFDAGWYGQEFRTSSDPTQVIPAIDMDKVIKYGKERGIGLILYVNKVGLYAKLDTILPLYKKWGVAGLKFGFVDGLTQNGIKWLNQAIGKVNNFGFILDIHDNYKPTGLSRIYPALLTQEGIRGDENSPDAFHTTVLPFTRFLAGPADFTFCYPNSKESFKKNLKVSKVHQLALSVIYFSPLQSLYWYGKPLDYTNSEELEFFDYLPTVWNESQYLMGNIGENIAIARRKGEIWFMGAVSGLKDWETNQELNFLKHGIIYNAAIYEDDETGNIRKSIKSVKYGDTFSFNIKAKGGLSIIFTPKNIE